jgi:hypothetical protein
VVELVELPPDATAITTATTAIRSSRPPPKIRSRRLRFASVVISFTLGMDLREGMRN